MSNSNNNTVNIDAKDRFARILATENIHVQHSVSASTASFNTQSRELTLPKWREMTGQLYDMLVAHEVGHALYTPADIDSIHDIAERHGVDWGVVKDYVNIIEDARIERLMKQKFPGLRRDFIAAYSDLLERDFFGISDKDPNHLTFPDRINIHYKVGTVQSVVSFDKTEEQIIHMTDRAESWEDVLDVVEALILHMQNDIPEKPSKQSETGQGDGPGGQDVSEEEGDTDGDLPTESTEQGDEKGQPDSPSTGDESSDETGDDAESDEPTQGGSQTGEAEVLSRPETTKSMEENMQDLRDDRRWQAEEEMMTMPKIAKVEDIIIDWKNLYYDPQSSTITSMLTAYADHKVPCHEMDEIETFLRESQKTCHMMAQEFKRRQRATSFRRATVAKTGVLDMQKMVNYKWSEDIFRKTTILPDGKNHGLVVAVDWSGSMNTVMKDTIRQAIQMAMFCRAINIPFEVYSFSSVSENFEDSRHNPVKFKSGDKDIHSSLNMRNYLSSRMSKTEFKECVRALAVCANAMDWSSSISTRRGDMLGATPLDDCIFALADILPGYRQQNGIEVLNTLIISDGDTTSQLLQQNEVIREGFRYFRCEQHQSTTVRALDVLRHRVPGSKVIQFFLSEHKNISSRRSWRSGVDETTREFYNKNKWCIAKEKQGFDERFIMFGKNSVQNADEFDEIGRSDEDGVTITKIRNSFVKSLKRSTTSRAMLVRFIDLIA